MLSKLDYILDLGGSIVNPGALNESFLHDFQAFIKEYVTLGKTFGIVVGGGAITRQYQDFLRQNFAVDNTDLDMIGIRPTKLNAELVRIILKQWAYPQVLESPEQELEKSTGNVLIFSGWKPGWSTDYVAALAAKRFGAAKVYVLSNIKGVYPLKDGKLDEGNALASLSWQEYQAMTSGEWMPGMKIPFDPVATQEAKDSKIDVLIMDGLDLGNVRRCLDGQAFVGTTIS